MGDESLDDEWRRLEVSDIEIGHKEQPQVPPNDYPLNNRPCDLLILVIEMKIYSISEREILKL